MRWFSRNMAHMLAIKASVVVVLVTGFVVTILVPRLAIMKLGELEYGIYALIIGFSSVIAFCDLGLIPGLTRQFAALIAAGNSNVVAEVIRRNERSSGRWLLLLASIVAIVLALLLPKITLDLVIAYSVFIASSWITILAEIRAALLRAAGQLLISYWIKTTSLISYVLALAVFFVALEEWPGVSIVFVAQCLSSVVALYLIHRVCARASLIGKHEDLAPSLAVNGKLEFENNWGEVWRVSAPERLNRVIQLVVGFIERPLLVATIGFTFLTSYDLFLRLLLLVSAVPSALSAPLLAMLAHDAARTGGDRRFDGALGLATGLNFALTILGVGVALTFFLVFHDLAFGVKSQISIPLGLLLIASAAINVLTAPGTAALTALGVVRPSTIKLSIEGVGMVIGICAALLAHDGVVFIMIRAVALIASAVLFMLMASYYTRHAA